MILNKLKMAVSGIISVFLVSCVPGMLLPGEIHPPNISQFDGHTELSMEPAWLKGGVAKLSLYKSTRMEKDSLVLTALVEGATNFADDESLHFNLDGQIYSFESLDDITNIWTDPGSKYIEPQNWSEKRYEISLSFIQKTMKAENVIVKIDTTSGYYENVFSDEGQFSAKTSFRNFLAELEKIEL